MEPRRKGVLLGVNSPPPFNSKSMARSSVLNPQELSRKHFIIFPLVLKGYQGEKGGSERRLSPVLFQASRMNQRDGATAVPVSRKEKSMGNLGFCPVGVPRLELQYHHHS